LRIRQFNTMDKSRNGYLSYSEVEMGIRDIIKLPVLFYLPPVLRRAFDAAVADIRSTDEDYRDEISNRNYCLMLKYLR